MLDRAIRSPSGARRATAIPEVDPTVDDEILKLRFKFDVIDTNNSGSIDMDELRSLLTDLRHEATDEQVERMFTAADKSGSASRPAHTLLTWLAAPGARLLR